MNSKTKTKTKQQQPPGRASTSRLATAPQDPIDSEFQLDRDAGGFARSESSNAGSGHEGVCSISRHREEEGLGSGGGSTPRSSSVQARSTGPEYQNQQETLVDNNDGSGEGGEGEEMKERRQCGRL